MHLAYRPVGTCPQIVDYQAPLTGSVCLIRICWLEELSSSREAASHYLPKEVNSRALRSPAGTGSGIATVG